MTFALLVKAKPGTCPTNLTPPSSSNCQSNCQSDDDCDGAKKCCFNGCASVCSDAVRVAFGQSAAPSSVAASPQGSALASTGKDSHFLMIQGCILKIFEACTKLKAAIEALPSGSVLDSFVPVCESDGRFRKVQCDRRVCWCVDSQGQEVFGTKAPLNRPADCESRSCGPPGWTGQDRVTSLLQTPSNASYSASATATHVHSGSRQTNLVVHYKTANASTIAKGSDAQIHFRHVG